MSYRSLKRRIKKLEQKIKEKEETNMSLKSLKNQLERLRKKSNTQRVQPSDPVVKNLPNGKELIGLSIPDAIDKICEWVDSIESDRPEYQEPEM